MADFDGLKKRIRALSKMTTENGCTEAEAFSAAQKLTDLLDANGLSAADVEEDLKTGASADLAEDAFDDGRKRSHEVWLVANEVAALFDCMVWSHKTMAGRKTKSQRMVFYGYAADSAAAVALIGIIREAMEREWRVWSALGHGIAPSRVQRSSFMLAMADRLKGRLHEMKDTRTQASETGTALVVLKTEVVRQAFEATGEKLGRAKPMRRKVGDPHARAAGRVAGDRVALASGRSVSNA